MINFPGTSAGRVSKRAGNSCMLALLATSILSLSGGGCGNPDPGMFCYGDGLCVLDGVKMLDDGRPICELDQTCDATGTSPDNDPPRQGDGLGQGGDEGPDNTPPPGVCDCRATEFQVPNDADGDCIDDDIEDANSNGGADAWIDSNGDGCYQRAACCDGGTCSGGEICDTPGEMSTVATDSDNDGFADGWDTDNDGIGDGCEDRNKNGLYSPGELNFFVPDTDCDGVEDGIEDRNHNGAWEPGEADARNADSDGDGIEDGIEDANKDGQVTPWIDVNGNGCIDAGDTPGETSSISLDSDDDGIGDQLEDRNANGICDNGETCAWHTDTDCDGLLDGREDLNRNGIRGSNETDPLDADSDDDGLPDGVEDANGNGTHDIGLETNPMSFDTDGDGLPDGGIDTDNDGIADRGEDLNLNGIFDGGFVDNNSNGCFDEGDVGGETDPRRADSDGDGIRDNLEDSNQNGICDVQMLPHPINPTTLVRTFLETCAFTVDTDCDGLEDGVEDVNRNGAYSLGELNPRTQDTDFDGLLDGCPIGIDPAQCEDKNNNNLVDFGESDPHFPDTDGDDLMDGCEINFDPASCTAEPCSLDPLSEDTDGDGFSDGEEDKNHNCIFEPNGEDGIAGNDDDETDPRLFDPIADLLTLERSQWNVCATPNLKRITFAESSRETHDYKLALEVEKAETGDTCTTQADCPAEAFCEPAAGMCIIEAEYHQQAYGLDDGDGSFNADDPNDTLLGQIFQSPTGIVTDLSTGEILNRDVYGFVLVREDTRDIDDMLDTLRDTLVADASFRSVVQAGDVPSRPSHDNLPNYRISRAQRFFRIETPARISALALRNQLLTDDFMAGDALDPQSVPPTVDPVYGPVICPNNTALCHDSFTLYVGAAHRLDQEGENGAPVMVTIVSLTPDNSDKPDPLPRFYNDRASRLEDLTGGSALGRFAAETGKICDELPQNEAVADMLWVVDDSRSMQQVIERLQQAALDAQAVLTANSAIVDFRTAMTTTNPARSARNQCPSECGDDCSGAGCNAATCNQWLGCFKACPESCTDETCGDAACTAGSNYCAASTTSTANGCPGGSDAECADGERCAGTDCVTEGCTASADINDTVNTEAMRGWTLPGGGGQFYFEDSTMLDCDSSVLSGQTLFTNPCCDPSDPAQAPCPEFANFFAANGQRKALTDHAGFLGSSPDATCTTDLMDLSFDASDAGTTCTASSDFCCPRLTDSCEDGPTVLASQMCDLIRTMGGLPGFNTVTQQTTSGARPHSAPEQGSRSARRLLESMLPALPRDYCLPTETPPACSGGSLDPKEHLRLTCDTSPACQPCDPRDDVDCNPVPMATIVLSDEEDFWFKDDCSTSASGADKRMLPSDCYYLDGDPSTAEECTRTYCESSGFLTDMPTGYDPDSAGHTLSLGNTLKWRDDNAAQCNADDATTCAGDPCIGNTDQPTCDAVSYCGWRAGQCLNQCALHANPNPADCSPLGIADCNTAAHCQWIGVCTGLTDADVARSDCEADTFCRWERAFVNGAALGDACVMQAPTNDCQPCKRLLRTHAAVEGGIDESSGIRLVGFGDLGPVYAIVRDAGTQGFGEVRTSGTVEDECGGGSVTWGRGDGQAYRDIARATLGRTQNVCATSYRDFMQLVVADIAALSAPYPLSGAPIAATLKVGIARETPVGSDEYVYFEVPRSRTQGFFYDATSNSVAFKSDPIDGQCGELACSQNGIIEKTEVSYARTREEVPKAGDLVFISYRFWRPVPCLEQCADDETCARVVCVEENDLPTTCDFDIECPAGYICDSGPGGTCALDCTVGDLIDVCVPGPCQDCEERINGLCIAANNTCLCNDTDATACDPNAHDTCGIGLACDESCICLPVPGCGTGFNSDGSVINCQAALDCCLDWDGAQTACEAITDETECNTMPPQAACDSIGESNPTDCAAAAPCEWSAVGGCAFKYPTCCFPGEDPRCFADPETGEAFLFCAPEPCVCSPECASNQVCIQDPGTGACGCFLIPG